MGTMGIKGHLHYRVFSFWLRIVLLAMAKAAVFVKNVCAYTALPPPCLQRGNVS